MNIRIDSKPLSKTVEKGSSLYKVLLDEMKASSVLHTPCGGKGTCGKCKVRVSGLVSPPTEKELSTLTVQELDAGIRLACQTAVLGDIEVHTLDAGRNAQIQTDGLPIQVELDPLASGEYGVAVDIGTTTLVVYLVDLKTGSIKAVLSKMNQQLSYGADVISRISFCMENKEGTDILHRVLVNQIDSMIREIAKKHAIDNESVSAMTLAGNTTMMHLLMGLSPESIGKAPFTPLRTESYQCSAGELGFGFNHACKVYLPPSISGYIGADIVAGILACDLSDTQKVQLIIDIGTNGEMALSKRGAITSCSAAAGPAFEGACIKCGVGGIEGAIDAVWLDQGKLCFHTLFDKPPVGICGSGLVDFAALLLQYGILDEAGRFTETEEWDSSVLALKDRVMSIKGEQAFVIAFPEETAQGEPIYIGQQDVREVQLAKAAVRAGLVTLMNNQEIGYKDIDILWLAGGFGNKLRKESAVTIGLLPKELEDKIVYAGNTSGTGAMMALLSGQSREKCDTIKKEAAYLELSGLASFNDAFIEALGF